MKNHNQNSEIETPLPSQSEVIANLRWKLKCSEQRIKGFERMTATLSGELDRQRRKIETLEKSQTTNRTRKQTGSAAKTQRAA